MTPTIIRPKLDLDVGLGCTDGLATDNLAPVSLTIARARRDPAPGSCKAA